MTKKILVIDDHPETLRLISIILQRADYEVHTAQAGEQGIALAQEIVPDLILLDIMMPGINGVVTCERLRKDSNPQIANCTIVMFSARSMNTDKEAALDADADGYIVKPTRPNELLALVKSYLDNPRAEKTAAENAAPATASSIVIVDIDPAGNAQSFADNVAAVLAVSLHTYHADNAESRPTDDQAVIYTGGSVATIADLLPQTSDVIICMTHDLQAIYQTKQLLDELRPKLSDTVTTHVVQLTSGADTTSTPNNMINTLIEHVVALTLDTTTLQSDDNRPIAVANPDSDVAQQLKNWLASFQS